MLQLIINIMEDLQLQESSFDLLFSGPAEIEFVEPGFDFGIDPDHFIRWLSEEHGNDQYNEWEDLGSYHKNVCGECEFACLYFSMINYLKSFDADPVVYDGKFGFWDHFWIGYIWRGEEYFIDLTLQQFIPEAPRVAISKASKQKKGYFWYDEADMPISEYVDRKNAFAFYLDPNQIS